MHKDNIKKSEPIYVDFPAGTWTIIFGLETMENYPWTLGLINLIETDDPHRRYVGAIQFNEKVNVVDNTPFPLYIEFTPEDGAIHFHVLGASKDFDQHNDLPPKYHFKFDGTYGPDLNGKMALFGKGGVPASFCPEIGLPRKAKPGLPEEDGEDVNWTSKGITDPGRKHSR